MNTLSIQKSIMELSIANMQNVINKKYSNSFDITSNIMVETIDNHLVFKATDYELFLKITIPIQQETNVRWAINGEAINSVIKTLGDDDLIIKQEENSITIKQNKTTFKIPTIDIKEFPFHNDYTKMEKIDIDPRKLISGIKKILHCCNEKDDNLAIQGIFIESKYGEINIVATYTKRLAFIKEKRENNEDFQLIIPKKAILESIRIFNDDFEFYIKREKEIISTICMVNQTHEFYARTLDVKFPDYQRLINDKKPQNEPVIIKREKFLKSLNQINSICQRLKIIFSKEGITIEALDGINGATASIVIDDAEVPFDNEKQVAFTNKHLIEYLSTTKSEDIEILIGDSNSAVFFKSNDLEEIIMPRIL